MKTNTHQDTAYFGFWLYILSDCLLFAGLFATYAVLRLETAGGIGPEDLLNLPYVFAETVVLLLSNLAMGLALATAGKSVNDDDKSKPSPARKQAGAIERPVLTALAATLLLGFVFLGLEAHEFMKLIAEGHGPTTSAFLSSFFALVGTHGLHVALGSLWMVVVMAHIATRGISASYSKLRLLGLFWHFLDIVWIFIFSVVYLLSATL